MFDRILAVVVIAMASFPAVAAETYRWEDEKGAVHYSDQLPPEGARNVTRTKIGRNVADTDLPYRLKIAVEKSPVTLYVTECGTPCRQARELLVKRGVPHTLLDAKERSVQEALLSLLGSNELIVPVASVGDTVLKGFESSQWNAALDAAGYPSYPMIEVKPHVPEPTSVSRAGGDDGSETAVTDDETATPAEPELIESEVGDETVEDAAGASPQ